APLARLPVAIGALAFLFLGVFLLYPLWRVLSASVLTADGSALTLQNYARVLSRTYYRASILNSLTIGALASLTTTLIALPLAFGIARLEIRGKLVLIGLAALPLILPSFVGAYALLLLFGRSGIITQTLNAWGLPIGSIYGTPGIVLVYTMTLYPYVLLPTVAALKAVDRTVEEAAESLGSTPARTFRTLTLPLVAPSVLSGALLVLIETLENFGVPAVLAEDKAILAVEAYKLFIGETATNPAAAAVLGTLLIALTALILLIQRRYITARSFATGARRIPPPVALTLPWRILATSYCWGVVLLALVPFFAIVTLSFLEFRGPVLHRAFSLGNYAELLSTASGPLANTLILASLAAGLAGVIGVPVGWVLARTRSSLTSVLDVVATLPFAIAGTVLAIGLIIAFNSGGLVLTGGWLIIVIAYTVRKLPFTVRASSAIVHQIEPSLEEASVSLGVPPLVTFLRLTVPLMLGGIVSGLVLTWVTLASELSSTVVLYSGPWRTLTVVMFQALEGTGAGVAVAAASVLIAIALIPVLIAYRLLRANELSML
ncbi:MAG: iron ABC transporter permease, partial [Hyphomicrobiaceae bacterium]|nr:iron ABC transporter permease [Hyphomicrobiaceae bacterium]